VSHLAGREEKDCLNCGTTVAGRYCQHCGQENLPPKESLWHLIVHFFNDFTHFDGKFFSTVRLLLFKPGFLSQEYMLGRRARYLNPIRMYLFVSFTFFLFLFSLPEPSTDDRETRTATTVGAPVDTSSKRTVIARTDRGVVISTDDDFINDADTTVALYDKRQLGLPAAQRDNVVRRFLTRRAIALQEYQRKDPERISQDFSTRYKQAIPKVFFISIPFFAGILQLLYIRRKKTWYYVSHSIFAIHFYCATFLIFFGVYLFRYLGDLGSYVALILVLGIFIYLYLAMKRFYQQGSAKTFLKYLLLVVAASIVLTVLMFVSALNAVFSLGAH
jgi:hypothetical protein